MNRLFSLIFLFAACMPAFAEDSIPKSEIPDNHLAYFDFHGPVAQVTEYRLSDYSKTIWNFDKKGRLIYYEEYGSPFAGDGGCVFRLMKRYKYAYDKKGKIMFLDIYDEDYALVDDYADVILELFPPRNFKDKGFEKADKEYGDSTYCYSQWQDNREQTYYCGMRYDTFGNLIEKVNTIVDPDDRANITIREFVYYKRRKK